MSLVTSLADESDPATPALGAGLYWPHWRMACSSVAGQRHLDGYRECQDAFRCNFATLVDPRTLSSGAPPQPLVATLSDGLGSADNSAAGATLAVSIAQANAEAAFRGLNWAAVTPRLLKHYLSRALSVSLDQFGEAVKSVAAAMGGSCPESSFAATLIVVVFRPPWLLAANIGDGFVVARRATEQMLMVSRPYVSSVDASAVTTALSARAMANASLIFLYDPELRGFAASTDGLQDISLEWDGPMPLVPHAEFFGPFFSGVADGTLTSAQLARFLHQKRIADEAADDLTLVAMAYGSED